MFQEPPAKRQRLMANGGGLSSDDDSDFDELNFEPHQVTEMRDPDYKLVKKRVAANNRFQSAMADIIARYDRDFGETGDEISFATGELVVDRGHISGLRAWDADVDGQDEGEAHGDGDEEEGIRLEDFLDEWEDEHGAEEVPDDSSGQEPDLAQGSTQWPATAPPLDKELPQGLTPEETHTSLRFEVVIPSNKEALIADREGSGTLHHTGGFGAGDRVVPETSPEEYDSGFASSSSECRRSGRVRKQVDFLGKITWAEALEQTQALKDVRRERSPTPSVRDSRTLADDDYEIELPLSPNVKGSSFAVDQPENRPLGNNAIVPDSQDSLAVSVASPPSTQHLAEPSDVQSPGAIQYGESDIAEPVRSYVQQLEVPDSQEDDLWQDAAVPEFTKPPSPAVSETMLPEASRQVNQDLTADDAAAPSITDQDTDKDQRLRIVEIRDSQEPSSSPDQEAHESQKEMEAEVEEDPSINTRTTEVKTRQSVVEATPTGDAPMSFDDWVKTSPQAKEQTSSSPSKKPREIVQQVTPGPSPNKHSTPSKLRSSAGTPRTPRHSTIHTSKPPSSRRSILSLLSDDHNDTGGRSDDEDELVRDTSDYSVPVAKLFDSARKRRKSRTRNAFLTPVKKRTEPRMTPTPLGSGKVCGQGDKKCGSSFCFSCM